jgi:hypothetical protein
VHHSHPALKPPGAFVGNQRFERRLNDSGFVGEAGKHLRVIQEPIID